MDMSLIGQKFNNLTVIGIKRIERKDNRKMFLCICDCGCETLASKPALINGRKKSCGCMKVNPIEKYDYLIEQKINKWTVKEIKNDKRVCYAICKCECGSLREVNIYNLINNKSTDCGCGRKQTLSKEKSSDLIGERFGRLKVIECLSERKHNRLVYRCRCDCGNIVDVQSNCLINNHTQSCGCILSLHNSYIAGLLNSYNIDYQPEYAVIIDGTMYRYDFYIPAYNLLIEYDGEQHYYPVNFGNWDENTLQERFMRTKSHDLIKNKYCEDHGVNLLRIPYWEKENIEKIINNCLQRLSEKGLAIA